MKDLLLIIVPLAGAAIAAGWPDNRSRPWLLPLVGLIHAGLSLWLLIAPPQVRPGTWLAPSCRRRRSLWRGLFDQPGDDFGLVPTDPFESPRWPRGFFRGSS